MSCVIWEMARAQIVQELYQTVSLAEQIHAINIIITV